MAEKAEKEGVGSAEAPSDLDTVAENERGGVMLKVGVNELMEDALADDVMEMDALSDMLEDEDALSDSEELSEKVGEFEEVTERDGVIEGAGGHTEQS